jgi:hypothetical protein
MFPYRQYRQSSATILSAPVKVGGIHNVAFVAGQNVVPRVDAIKSAISVYGSVCVGVYVDRYFQAYTGGVLTKCVKKPRSVNHMERLRSRRLRSQLRLVGPLLFGRGSGPGTRRLSGPL